MTKIDGKTASTAARGDPRRHVRQVIEAEMDEALGAVKGERTPERLGYRSGYYGRTLITGRQAGRPPDGRGGAELLTRTTRNVVPTQAGERLMETLRPALNDIRRRIE